PVLTFLRSHVPTLSRSYALTRPRRQLLQHGGEEADAEAGGALRAVAVAGVEEGRAGDVHVHPVVGRRGVGAGEVLEEGGGRDRAALAPADVGEVGHVALELLLEVGVERERPREVARRLGRTAERREPRLGPLVGARDEGGDAVAEGDHGRAGEGG